MIKRLFVPIGISLLFLPLFTSAASCPNLYRTLQMGSSGNDVTALQQFLIETGDLAPGNAIGLFGPRTRAAVRSFQCREMQICSGSESTTGWGRVGAMTRAKIASVCGNSATVSANFSANPTWGVMPLNVSFSIHDIPLEGIDSRTWYSVDFGDGTQETLDRWPLDQAKQHTYGSAGTYTAQLIRTSNPCAKIVDCQRGTSTEILGTVTITVTGASSATPNDKLSCERIGGQWGWVYGEVAPGTPQSCNMPTSDAGKSCTDSSQCQSFCEAPAGTAPGAPATGKCYGWAQKDCAFSVEDGRAIIAIMCS